MSDGDIRILSDVDKLARFDGCAIVIRHADREGQLDSLVTSDQLLTEKGRRRAFELGAGLKRFSKLRFYSSSVPRCVETCERIAEGRGIRPEIVTTGLLGVRAPFMQDPERAYRSMKSIGLVPFIEAYVQGRLDHDIVMSCEEGGKLLLSQAIKEMDKDEGACVFVTHDMIITPFMAYLFGFDFKTLGLVPFLDGFVVGGRDGRYHVRYGEKEVMVRSNGDLISKASEAKGSR